MRPIGDGRSHRSLSNLNPPLYVLINFQLHIAALSVRRIGSRFSRAVVKKVRTNAWIKTDLKKLGISTWLTASPLRTLAWIQHGVIRTNQSPVWLVDRGSNPRVAYVIHLLDK